jgi:hypothetical protein
MIKKVILTILLVNQIMPLYAADPREQDTWRNMIDGISRYSADAKLREQFDALCREHQTALVDGRIDTGGGLYMIMDVPVYREPGRHRRAALPHETRVVLTGQTQKAEKTIWQEIEFLFISDYSKMAVSIDKAWIPESNLTK